MDFLDEMLACSPKEKFLQMLQNASVSAVERAIEKLLKEHIALRELLERKNELLCLKNGENSALNKNAEFSDLDEEISLFCVENSALIDERLNDYFIGLTAEILGVEG